MSAALFVSVCVNESLGEACEYFLEREMNFWLPLTE